MELKTILSCPLGHVCQRVSGDHVDQCAWFVKLAGMNPNTGQEIDEFGCAMSWLPILLIENGRQQRSTAAAVESFRNEVVQANEQHLVNARLIATLNNNQTLLGGPSDG